MNVTVQRISSARFAFLPDTREFCAELVELGHGGVEPLGRLSSDSDERGFVMVSAATGQEVAFVLTDVARDADHTARLWELVPTAHELVLNPGLDGVRVVLLGD